MSKRQTRRSVSLSAPKFARLQAKAAALRASLSSVVEGWIDKHCQDVEVYERAAKVVPPAPPAPPAPPEPVLYRAAAQVDRARVLDKAGDQLRAELPSKAKVDEVHKPSKVVIAARTGMRGF